MRDAAKGRGRAAPAWNIAPKHWLALLCIVAMGTSLRAVRLGAPGEYVFDETYYAFTARQYLAGNRDAYDPLAKKRADEKVAYEWTHPPLARLIMTATMAVAGDGWVGARLSSVVMGGLATVLVFLVSVALFASPLAGLLASFLYSIEGLSFVHSRLALPDVHLSVFFLASILFYTIWRKGGGRSLGWLAAAGAAAGMALSVKWTGLYLLGALGVDFLIFWVTQCFRAAPASRVAIYETLPLAGAVCLIVLPAAVYLACYGHYFRMGYSWAQFVELQRQMWAYHTGLKEGHPYQSRPWQWALNLRPVWMWVHYDGDERIANIYDLGNSVVLWFGLAAAGVLAVRSALRRTWPAIFLLAIYLACWLPWTFSPRIMFFYHYLPAVPMLCIASGLLLASWIQDKRAWVKLCAWTVLALAAAWFVFFLPQMTGIEVPRYGWLERQYAWWCEKPFHFIQEWVERNLSWH